MSCQNRQLGLKAPVLTNGCDRHGSLQNSESNERIEKMLSQNQGQLTDWVTAMNSRLAEVEGALVNSSNSSQPTEQPQDAPGDVLAQIREERQALDASRQLIQDLLERTRELAAESSRAARGNGDRTSVKFGYNNQGLQMGVNTGTIGNLRFGGS